MSVWERTLRWLKEERGLRGDSLRKPTGNLASVVDKREGNQLIPKAFDESARRREKC